MKEHPKYTKPDIILSSVGFKLTPAIERQVKRRLNRLRKTRNGIVRIRAKLRLFTNGPRRDSFQVRLRLEMPGPDLICIQQGHDLYKLIQEAADITISRMFAMSRKKKDKRRVTIQQPEWA